MKIVSNSSILISLSSINRLYLLKEKFDEIYIPEAVWEEVVEMGKGETGSKEVRSADWIIKEKVTDENLVSALNENLDLGESEAISLAIQLNSNIILLDEKEARVMAAKYKLKPLGTVGVLIWARKKNIIKNLKLELDKLIREGGFRIASEIYEKALAEVGESFGKPMTKD